MANVLDIALDHLAMAFVGMRSSIFESRGKQRIKELKIRAESNFKDWISRERPDTEYEHNYDSHRGSADNRYAQLN